MQLLVNRSRGTISIHKKVVTQKSALLSASWAPLLRMRKITQYWVDTARSVCGDMAGFGIKNKGDRGFSADRALSKIYTELWELDENRLKPGTHYCINLQGGRL